MFSIPFLTDGSSFKSSVVRTVNALITENKRLNNEIENLKRQPKIQRNFFQAAQAAEPPYCGMFDVKLTDDMRSVKIFDSLDETSNFCGSLVGYYSEIVKIPNFNSGVLTSGRIYTFIVTPKITLTAEKNYIVGTENRLLDSSSQYPPKWDKNFYPVVTFFYVTGKVSVLWRATWNSPIRMTDCHISV